MLSSSERKILSKINFLQKKSTINKNRFSKNGGIDFRQLRDYMYGDDIRSIDWKSSARTQKLVVKEFMESIAFDLFLLLDLTKSTNLGINYQKSQLLKKVVYALAWRALQQKCQVHLAIVLEDNFLSWQISSESELLRILINFSEQINCQSKILKKSFKTLDKFVDCSACGKLILVSDFLDDRLINLNTKNKILGLRLRDYNDFHFLNYPGYVADPENDQPKFMDYAGSKLAKINKSFEKFWQKIDLIWTTNGRQIVDLDQDNLIFSLVKSLGGKL